MVLSTHIIPDNPASGERSSRSRTRAINDSTKEVLMD
jgi:hypothetical protein